MAAACAGDEDPAAPGMEAVQLGRVAFANECAPCHTALDGFDLAFFGFASADIVRRALSHVDEETAHNIAAYIRSLPINAVGRDTPPFQPGNSVVSSDATFWQALFGTAGWPASLTPESLRDIRVRDVDIPLQLPLWSVEMADTDWLPATPLTDELRNANGAALHASLEAYRAAPTEPRLLTLTELFRTLSTASPQSVCAGEPAAQPRARECFEARRWLSALTALHYLRSGETAEIPIEIIDLWWETGEAAQAVYFREIGSHDFDMVSGWLYLGYSFAPTRFPDTGGYLEQFLQLSGRPRLATFAALRRMVDEQDVHNAAPAQRFNDALIAALRAPPELRAPVMVFVLEFLADWTPAHPLAAPELADARAVIDLIHTEAHSLPPQLITPTQLDRITQLHATLLPLTQP